MKLNKKTLAAVKNNVAKIVAKTTTATAKVTDNYWKKLKELGAYTYGVRLYMLRRADYTSQVTTEWSKAKGAEQKMVLFVSGSSGLGMLYVNAKGSIVRVSSTLGFDTAQIKGAQLMTANKAIAYVKAKGKAVNNFVYNGKTRKGYLLDNGKFYNVFTNCDGNSAFLFSGEAARIAGKGEEQANKVWSYGKASK